MQVLISLCIATCASYQSYFFLLLTKFFMHMNKRLHYLFFLLFVSQFAFAQLTVGTLSFDVSKSYDGYNLLFPHNQPNVYLLDNCGRIAHVWEDDPSFRPGNMAYLMENGDLIKCKRPASVAGNPIWAGGGGGTVEIRSWDNELLWSFTLNDGACSNTASRAADRAGISAANGSPR